MAHVFTGMNGGPVLHANGAQGHLQQQHPQQPAPSFDIDMLISDPNATTSEDSEQQHAPAKCRLSDAGTSSAAGPPAGNGLWQSAGCATGDWQQHGQQQQGHWSAGAAGAGQAAGTAEPAKQGAAAEADPQPAQNDNPVSKDSSTIASAAAAGAAPAPVAPRSSDDSTAAQQQQQQQVLQQFTLHCSSPVDGSATVATAHVDGKPQQLQFTTVAVSGAPTPDLQQPLTIQSIQPMIVADAAMLQQIIQQQQQQQQNGGSGTEGLDSKAGVMGNIPLSLPAVYDEHALQQLLQQVVATAPDTDTAIWQQPGAASSAADAGAVPGATSPSAAGKDTQLKLLHLVPLTKQLQPVLPAIAPISGRAADSPVKQQAGSDSADAAAVANAAVAEATAAADAAVAAAASAPNAAAAAALAGNMLGAGSSGGMQVFVASPAGKPGAGVLVPASMLSPGVFTPGANKEELKGCCEALMMLRDLSKPGEDAGGAAHGTGVIAMMPNKPGVGAAAALAAVRSTAAMAAEAPAAAPLTMPGHALPPVAPLQAQVPQGNSHQLEQQRVGAVQGGAEPQLGRGKRVRKPQQWSQQMQLLDQLVDSVEHSGGSSADYHAHPGQQLNPAAAAEGMLPAAKRQRRQLPGAGGAAAFEDDEADESYDAAADANGDEEEAAELAEYEEEIMQYDQGEDAAGGAAAAVGNGRRRSNSKRGGARGRYVPRKLKDNKAIFERTGAGAASADTEPMPPPLSHSWGSCSYLGVSKKRSGKWQAAVRFGHDGSYAFWCCYGCPKQAARARDAAALALRGPAAARLNFPEDTYSDAEILAAAAHILQKHPHLHPLEHPLLRTMSLADILGGGPAGLPVDAPAAPAEDSAAVPASAEGPRAAPASSSGKRSPQREVAASGAAAASAPAASGGAASTGGKSRMGARHKGSTHAAAATQVERATQQQHHPQQQQQQQQEQQQQPGDASPVAAVGGEDAGNPPIDTATMFSRLFDLAALVVFGPCAATETPASAFYPEELAAAAAAMSCRMPPGGLASVQEHLQSLAQAQQEQQRLQQQQQQGNGNLQEDMAAAAEEDVPAVVKQVHT